MAMQQVERPADLPDPAEWFERLVMLPEWGDRVQRHEYRLTPDNPLAIWRPVTSPPIPMSFDFHQALELGVTLEGQNIRQYEGLTYTAEPGDVWLCAMWEPHGWAVSPPGAMPLVLIFIPEFFGDESFEGISWLSLFAAPPQERPRCTTQDMRTVVLTLAQEIAQEVTYKRPLWKSMVRLGALRILAELARSWEPHHRSYAKSRIYTSDLSRIQPALDLVHHSPPIPIELRKAAQACGLSIRHFTRVFQHAMGISFNRFLMRFRLSFVAVRLLATDAPIETLADEAGFADASHLIHAFHRHYGCTPNQYRERTQMETPIVSIQDHR